MKCCLKQKLATKHRPISKECFICRMAYEYQIIMRWYLREIGYYWLNSRIHTNKRPGIFIRNAGSGVIAYDYEPILDKQDAAAAVETVFAAAGIAALIVASNGAAAPVLALLLA